MKKLFIPALMLVLVACGGNPSNKNVTKKTQTTQSCGDSGCTEDHSKPKHIHTENCNHGTEAKKEHVHGKDCNHDHNANKADAKGHVHSESCNHGTEAKEHVHGKDCNHDHNTNKADAKGHVHSESCNHGTEAKKEHVHGKDCNHDHNANKADAKGHVHSESCNHGTEAKHVHSESCNHSNDINKSKIHVVKSDNTEHGHPDPAFTEVSLKPSQAEQANIMTFEVEPSNFAPVMKVSGRISSAPQEKKIVVAPISGVVNYLTTTFVNGASVIKEKLYVNMSTKGIHGGDYIEKTKSKYEVAKSDFERAKRLIKDKLISQQDYNNIKLNYDTAKAEYKAVSDKQTKGGVGVASPINGFVNEVLVEDGSYVEAGTPLFSVTKNKNMILTAWVSERYYDRIKKFSTATFKTNYNDNVYDLKDMNGRLIAYGKGDNDNSYLVPITFGFDKNSTIFSGSYVDVYLKENTNRDALIVPVESITEEQGVYYVYVYRGALLFRKMEVKLGDSDGKYVQILSGVKPGDRVVFNGTYQVKLASSSGAIPAACGHAH